jgi:hypothetical protein
LQVTGAIRGSRFIRTVAQQRPAGWLPREGNCGNYLFGQAGKDVHAGYGDQWSKALEGEIDIIPTRLNRTLPSFERKPLM